MFKVEIRENCKICGSKLPNARFRTFCSKKCRDKSYAGKYNDYRTEFARIKRNKEASIPDKKKIKCQICGRYYRQLCTHVVKVHKIYAREYKETFGLDVKTGKSTLSSDLHKLYGEQAIENGTFKNLKAGKKYRFVKGDKKAGKYQRSEETIERLRNQSQTFKIVPKLTQDTPK